MLQKICRAISYCSNGDSDSEPNNAVTIDVIELHLPLD